LSVTQKLEKEAIGIKMGSKAFEESKVVVASNDQISQAEQYHFFWCQHCVSFGVGKFILCQY
jgi:hypothetical protein